MTIPYTYRIRFIPTGEYYYGVRYARNCHPTDLWTRYFTSSRKVKQLIEEFGKDSFVCEIRKIFETKEEAIAWERRITQKVIYWPNYMNANSAEAYNHEKCSNGGTASYKKGAGIHSMTPEQKSTAGKKGGKKLGERKKIYGLTEQEKAGIKIGRKKLSERRQNGEWTEREISAQEKINKRRKEGEWTDKEKAGYEKLRDRRKKGEWTDKEKDGFEKVSSFRKSGKWVTNGSENKFITDKEPPLGWFFGFTRKPKCL